MHEFSSQPVELLPVADIVVPEGGRRELGNVLILAGSIERVGLLHPLVVNSRRELIAGRRRLAAVKRLHWDRVPVRVVDSLDDAVLAIQAERDENTCREPLTVAESLEIGARLEALEKPKAKERQKRGGGKPGSGKLPLPEPKTRDKVAAALGVSGRTYEKAKQVAKAAEEEPEKFGDLPAKMDQQSIDAAHKELKKRRAAPKATSERAAEAADEKENARAAYLLRADAAIQFAKLKYEGPVTPEIADAACRVASAAGDLAKNLKGGDNVDPAPAALSPDALSQAERLALAIDGLYPVLNELWEALLGCGMDEGKIAKFRKAVQKATTDIALASDALLVALIPDYSMWLVEARLRRNNNPPPAPKTQREARKTERQRRNVKK